MILECSIDKDNLYFVQYAYNEKGKDKFEIIKYSIKQDTQTTVFEPDELGSNIFAIDDKLVFFTRENDQTLIRYLDMRNMENKIFHVEIDITKGDDIITDILFDGQQIIYEKGDRTLYSICIFTGETKKIELIN